MVSRTDIHANMREDDANIRIDHSHPFVFTRSWFKYRNQITWSTKFPIKYSSDRPLNMVQIGVWEGADLIWCLQNILEHPDSRVIAMDPWLPMLPWHDKNQMDQVQTNARNNLYHWRNKVQIIPERSQVVLPDITKNSQDLIVVDGCHKAEAVYQDALQALRIAKIGAWIVFDDVRSKNIKRDHVFDGIKRFVAEVGESVKLAWQHRYCDCYEVVT